MKNGPIKITPRETLIPGLISLLLMTGLLVLLMITGYLFTANADDRIAAAAKDTLAFKTYLKGDDIQIHSQDGAVTLTGTVADEPHLTLAADTVADLPGVKRVDNRLEVRAHAGPGLESSSRVISGPSPNKLTK